MLVELYYDKECPFCNAYANYIKIKENHLLILYNAREKFEDINSLRKKGFDINDGFVIIIDKKNIFQGSHAILVLNKLAKNKVPFLNNYFFKNIIYTFLKHIRILILKILNKKVKI